MPYALKLTAMAFALSILPAAGASAQSDSGLASASAAVQEMSASGELLSFSCGSHDMPDGGHLQGVQILFDSTASRRTVLLSHDSATVAYLAVVEFPGTGLEDFAAAGKLARVRRLPSDGGSPPLRHAGGFQLAGKVLAIGVEDNQDKKRSQIQFWKIAAADQLDQLTHLTISRASETPKLATAGAVGLLECEKDHLLAVGNWDCRAIDFYRSNGKPLDDDACRLQHVLKWQADSAATEGWKPDAIRGTYQSLNLVRDARGGTYLLGFDTTLTGTDVIDLFQVNLDASPERALQKVERKQVRLQGDNHFRYGGGAAVQAGKLIVLSTERNFQPDGATRLTLLTR
jgi:hypothetical protein